MAELDSYIAAWRERRARDELARAEARERALVLAQELADLLVTRYGARRVVLVGSLARGDFAPGSDIDLAAEGVPDDRFFAARLPHVWEALQADLQRFVSFLDMAARAS